MNTRRGTRKALTAENGLEMPAYVSFLGRDLRTGIASGTPFLENT
jgi:hypothetical protein